MRKSSGISLVYPSKRIILVLLLRFLPSQAPSPKPGFGNGLNPPPNPPGAGTPTRVFISDGSDLSLPPPPIQQIRLHFPDVAPNRFNLRARQMKMVHQPPRWFDWGWVGTEHCERSGYALGLPARLPGRPKGVKTTRTSPKHTHTGRKYRFH